MRSDALQKKKRDLEERLEKVESAINTFSRKIVFVKEWSNHLFGDFLLPPIMFAMPLTKDMLLESTDILDTLPCSDLREAISADFLWCVWWDPKLAS